MGSTVVMTKTARRKLLLALKAYAKCDGRLTYNQDQLLHVSCKCVYVTLLFVIGSVTL